MITDFISMVVQPLEILRSFLRHPSQPVQPAGVGTVYDVAPAERRTNIYLHVFDWLAGGRQLSAQAAEDGVLVSVPSEPVDPIATVIVMGIAGEPKVEKLPPRQAADGSMTLLAALIDIHDVGGGHLRECLPSAPELC